MAVKSNLWFTLIQNRLSVIFIKHLKFNHYNQRNILKRQDTEDGFMRHCQFYIIISKKSEEVVNGLKKYILGCENRADAHGFFWIDDRDNIQQLQLIFGEVVLEWFAGKWVQFSMTNRSMKVSHEEGLSNGAHILHPLENKALSDTVLDEARNAEYPPEWADKIMDKF
jgi:hypothetical protein